MNPQPATRTSNLGIRNFYPFLIAVILLLSGCEKEQPVSGTVILQPIDSLMQQHVPDSIPGAVLQVKQGDEVIHRKAYGYAQLFDADMNTIDTPVEMSVDHLFDIASLTKVFGTTFAVMKLVDEGALKLDETVGKYLPEFNEGTKKDIRIHQLLNHSSGLTQWYPLYYHASDKSERYQYLAEMPLKYPVGEERHYSDLGFMLLADIVETVTGKTVDQYLSEEIYGPLNLSNTFFNPLERGVGPEHIVATSHGNPFERRMVYDDEFGYKVDVDPESWNEWREYTLIGEVNDGNAWYANEGVAGHAGLFSTVGDLQVLVDLLLENGVRKGRRYISKAVIDTFLTRDLHGNGLGWAMNPAVFDAPDELPDGSFGHTGFTGTSAAVVPEYNLSVILLTNRQHRGPLESGYYYDLGELREEIVRTSLVKLFRNETD